MNDSVSVRAANLAAANAGDRFAQDAVVTSSGVSWGAVIAGAMGAAALSLILLILGLGLGLSSVSPWSGQGMSAGRLGASTILWLTFTQLAAAGIGGYLAGRLRTRWTNVHTDEVYFRDTAHGFLAWALATLATAAVLTSTIGSILSSGVEAGSAFTMSGASTPATMAVPDANQVSGGHGPTASAVYFVDSLFRKDATNATPTVDNNGRTSTEVERIFANALLNGSMPPNDTKYVAQLVAQHTGLSGADAEKRVADTFNTAQAQAKAAGDKARKTSAYAALWMFASLLIGAFVASFAATLGGRRRDMF